ncbi:hypothetical protein ACFSSF_07070 [Dietzia aerolata]|uniref:hypothetical protein n=1 Tax=Dietzia aerolata TaxID=595984 RepID=UPI00362B9137
MGPRLQRVGEAARRATWEWAEPVLRAVVDGTGETANMAVREGDGVVYLAQVPSPTQCGCSPRWGVGWRSTAPPWERRL